VKRKSHRQRQRKRYRHAPPGTSPGSVIVPDHAQQLSVTAIRYDDQQLAEQPVATVAALQAILRDFPSQVHWIRIEGLGNKEFYEQLADCFSIHRLQMEDVMNTYQRPKVEESREHLFLVSRILTDGGEGLGSDQLSLFLGRNFVISIQDRHGTFLQPVLDRLKNGKGQLRRQGADYLAYALMDLVIDTYYPVLEHAAEKLDEMEDELITNPTRPALNRLLQIKRDLILLRRTIWSERDKMNELLRGAYPVIHEPVKIFFRDSYDHCIQLIDLAESYKEITASLMDVYMSGVSNRLNQVMKVLTIISTIFIPLSFIVGLYGMNFARTNPQTGAPLPFNMPELYSPYGYVGVLALMGIIAVIQLTLFARMGWLKRS
jgi:magnesium transporter